MSFPETVVDTLLLSIEINVTHDGESPLFIKSVRMILSDPDEVLLVAFDSLTKKIVNNVKVESGNTVPISVGFDEVIKAKGIDIGRIQGVEVWDGLGNIHKSSTDIHEFREEIKPWLE